MHAFTWCFILTALLLIQRIEGVNNVDNLKRGQPEDENASIRNAIPGTMHRKRGPRHRRHHILTRGDRRALRHRYNSVLAISVGLGVAGGWICVATLVYVVRYMKAKREGKNRQQREGEDQL